MNINTIIFLMYIEHKAKSKYPGDYISFYNHYKARTWQLPRI